MTQNCKVSCALAVVFISLWAACANAQTVPDLQRLADSGNAAAQFKLGSLYVAGVGVERDLSKAFALLSKSADQGYTDAMASLSLMYGGGQGVKQEWSMGYVWAAIAERLAPEAKRTVYANSRHEMASWLSSAQIAAADLRVTEWLKAHHLPKEQCPPDRRPT